MPTHGTPFALTPICCPAHDAEQNGKIDPAARMSCTRPMVGGQNGACAVSPFECEEGARVLARLLGRNKTYNPSAPEVIGICATKIPEMLAQQTPGACVVACSDSRPNPQLLFRAGPNEIFSVTSAGNTVGTEALFSIEYAVAALNVPLLLVLPHSRCGAVAAAWDMFKTAQEGGDVDAMLAGRSRHFVAGVTRIHDHIASMANDLLTADQVNGGDRTDPAGIPRLQEYLIMANARQTADDILREVPIVRERIAEGKLLFAMGFAHMSTGRVQIIGLDTDKFLANPQFAQLDPSAPLIAPVV